jgi:addiction module HigA family antidote
MFNPPHPGEVLKGYLPAEVSVTVAAKRLGVSRQAFSAILNGRTGITADMALRLAKALETSPDLWLGMQMQFELWQAKRQAPKGVQKLAA